MRAPDLAIPALPSGALPAMPGWHAARGLGGHRVVGARAMLPSRSDVEAVRGTGAAA